MSGGATIRLRLTSSYAQGFGATLGDLCSIRMRMLIEMLAKLLWRSKRQMLPSQPGQTKQEEGVSSLAARERGCRERRRSASCPSRAPKPLSADT